MAFEILKVWKRPIQLEFLFKAYLWNSRKATLLPEYLSWSSLYSALHDVKDLRCIGFGSPPALFKSGTPHVVVVKLKSHSRKKTDELTNHRYTGYAREV
eukprot:Skav206491  [mRNA]  locus=scaffold1128:125429:125894:- [translate_table: standard]